MKYLKKFFKKNYIIISLIFISFFLGYFYKEKYPYFFYRLKNNLLFNIKYSFKNELKNCPEKISSLNKDSILIIGHAYGSHKGSSNRGDIGIAPKIKNFYLENKDKIHTIIFSGDVLKEPTINKWKDFYNNFDKRLNIFIAPGNHDVGGLIYDNSARNVFNLTKHRNQNGINFPFKVIINNQLFIIADSNSKEDTLKEIMPLLVSEKEFSNIFVIMHHVIPKGLEIAANAGGKHGYINDSILENKFKLIKDKNINFIYGDGGAFDFSPRIKCLKIGNTSHIVSGIGEVDGDSIIVISNKSIYRMEI